MPNQEEGAAPMQSVANYNVPPPEKFSFKPEEWIKWIRRFERFRTATGLEEKSKEMQVNTLIYSMGDQADDIFLSFGLSEDEAKDYNVVRKKFEEYFVVKKNVIFERAKFNSRVQRDGESVDNFITDLYCLVEYCEFGALKDELIRDRIVVGLKNRKLSEKLQLDSQLTLEKAIRAARQSETVKKQQPILHGENPENIDQVREKRGVKKWSKPKPTKGKQTESKHHSTSVKPNQQCMRCLGPNHPKKQCPARDSKCHSCSKIGHWSKACRGSSSSKVSEVVEGYFLGEVSGGQARPWTAWVHINEKPIQFKLDSGADVTVVPVQTYNSFGSVKLVPTKKVLLGPCNYKINCVGKFSAHLKVDKSEIDEEVYVIKDLETPLLSRKSAEKLQLIHRVRSIESNNYKESVSSKYPELFTGLGKMEDEYTIKLKDDAKPFALPVPRKVPMPLYQKTKAEIERMLETGVISPVDEPTEWCAPMVVTPKPNGQVRICVDLTKLNNFVQRENHPLPSIDTTLGKLAGAKYFSKLDANSGFWQIRLAESSKKLTTFITPWGRYCFNVLPYGISSGSEKFQKAMSRILESLEGVVCNIDDVLVWGTTQEEHDQRLDTVLQRLSLAHVTLNTSKCIFNVTKVVFLGHVVSAAGIEADPAKVAAITNLASPRNTQEVRSFLGMVNQLSKFTKHLADKTKPMRDLLKKDRAWTWGPEQVKAFEEVKTALTTMPVLALYDPNKETKITADASSYGLGGMLLQKQPDSTWRPIMFISRSLTPTESRYATIEKEALALTWACERCSDYIVGKSIEAETDHKPLVPLLTQHTLDQVPPRIQRFRMRLMRFHIKKMTHVPGKEHYTADALSRMQSTNQNTQTTVSDDDMNVYIASVMDLLPISDTKLQQVREAQDEDEVCKKIKEYCLEGWPEKFRLHDAIKPYWSVKGELTVVQGILLKSSRLVIPSPMRLDILDRVHEGHLGIVKCRDRAKNSVWWPGVSAQIKSMVENCQTCARHREQRPEPLIPTACPDRPWQRIAADLFQLKNLVYLLVVDYFSRYVEVINLQKSTQSTDIVRALKAIFARHGIPEELRSDNGPQFSSAEFTQFSKEWGFKHNTSSPRFPQANGEAERAVKTVKSILKKEKDPAKALLAYRSTPLTSGFSPAELLMGRRLRTSIPTLHLNLVPKWPDIENFKERQAEIKAKQVSNFNQGHRARALPAIDTNTPVYVKDKDTTGVVTGPAETPRSYVVDTPTGTVRRNRIHLIPDPNLNNGDAEKKQTAEHLSSPRKSDPRQIQLPSPCLASRPKRQIKPSLKLRESMGLD